MPPRAANRLFQQIVSNRFSQILNYRWLTVAANPDQVYEYFHLISIRFFFVPNWRFVNWNKQNENYFQLPLSFKSGYIGTISLGLIDWFVFFIDWSIDRLIRWFVSRRDTQIKWNQSNNGLVCKSEKYSQGKRKFSII